MYEPMWPFSLMYGSHDMRHTGFRRLTVVNGTPGKWGFTQWFSSHVLIRLSMDKWALCGHFYSYLDPMWSLYNIGSCCHVIVQVVFWVELLEQRRLCSFCVKSWVPEKGTRWCGVRLLDIHEYSAG